MNESEELPRRSSSRSMRREKSFNPSSKSLGLVVTESSELPQYAPTTPSHSETGSKSGRLGPSSPLLVDPHALSAMPSADTSGSVVSAASSTTTDRVTHGQAILQEPVSPDEFESVPSLVDTIRQSIIGDSEVVRTPFGQRRRFFTDYTSSGRPLGFIEQFILSEVLPAYDSRSPGAQIANFERDAASLVHEHVHGSTEDLVFFAGTGVSGAIMP
mmetsp:Transcript_26292/g.63936  ORF Transcript_26292/g.63936 Transcript_26292/m.63936 type:complete len:215 (+) Transcript_26292:19-663(+)